MTQRASRGTTTLSDTFLDAVFQHPAIGFAQVGLEGQLLRVNAALERILGYSSEELVGIGFVDVTHPEDREKDLKLFEELIRGTRTHYEIDKRYIHKEGHTLWGRLSVSLGRTKEGHPLFALGAVQDITDRKQTEEELRDYQEQVEELWRQATSGIAVLDRDGRVLKIYPGFTRMFGYTEEEAIGTLIQDLIAPADRKEELLSNLQMAVSGQTISGDTIRLRKDGQPLDVAVLGRSIRLPQKGMGVFVLYRDISARRSNEAELVRLSATDELTRLWNRRGLTTLAQQEIKRAEREGMHVVVVNLDLDQFKEINDNHGHKEGDKALVAVAQVLRESCRGSDIVARTGGDEFLIIALDRTGEGERLIPQRIRGSLDRFNATSGCPYEIKISIGTAVCPPNEPIKLDELFGTADQRMYDQKEHSRS